MHYRFKTFQHPFISLAFVVLCLTGLVFLLSPISTYAEQPKEYTLASLGLSSDQLTQCLTSNSDAADGASTADRLLASKNSLLGLSGASVMTTARPTVKYRAYLENNMWTKWKSNGGAAGNKTLNDKLIGLQLVLDDQMNGSQSGSSSGSYIKFRMRLTNGTWTRWANNAEEFGPFKTIEAIQFKLFGPYANTYDVVYRACIEKVGWQKRVRNGEIAGTKGLNRSLQGIKIALVEKSLKTGWIKVGTQWRYYKNGQLLRRTWFNTNESPINMILSGTQRYWINGQGNLAVNRFINPSKKYDKKASYVAWAGKNGNIRRGKFMHSKGLLLANKTTGALYTKTRWLATSAFGKKTQRYRLVKKGICAVVKTGMFRAGKKLYYAYPGKKRGYLLLSRTAWLNNNWYKANERGILKKLGKGYVVERYVRWAISIAKNNSHGYSQANRWGPDYDCSSLVCMAIRKTGIPNSGASWTGNMKACLKKVGFVWHKGTSGLQRGDILLVHNQAHQHTEIYIGNNKLVGAHCSETGGVIGRAGDQTGEEISVRAYYNMPWQGYLRYKS